MGAEIGKHLKRIGVTLAERTDLNLAAVQVFEGPLLLTPSYKLPVCY